MVKILHIITGLNVGGAETMLYKLLSGMDRSRFQSTVVSLSDDGVLGKKIAGLGVPVISLNMSGPLSVISGMRRLVRIIQESRPDIIQTWLHHADFMGTMAARMAGAKNVIWNLRCAALGPKDVSAANRVLVRILGFVSCLPAGVVANSRAGMLAHQSKGYRPKRWMVIPNGFDTNQFEPNFEIREAIRSEIGVSSAAPLIGLIGRYHPMKGHDVFLKAAARVLEAFPDAHFLLVGKGTEDGNESLGTMVRGLGLKGQVHLLGERQDMPAIMSALDILVSSSTSEGFPNVIGEAMACGVPCVATDTSDCREIIGDTGHVVPVGDISGIAEQCCVLLGMSETARAELSLAARARIIDMYSLSSICRRYESLYVEMNEKN